ncbi:MAG: FAD-binding oxidoreductase [Legionella sp.]|jgi:FAD/FMN-containing dehydrogenase
MELQLQKTWDTQQIKQLKSDTGQALLDDESTLVSFSQDFGKLIQSYPSAVSIPKDVTQVQQFISFAHDNTLPIVIRAKGLSQGGQSLPGAGGVTLSMQHFDKVLDLEADGVWLEANCTWASLLELSLKSGKAPFVLPYNCNLSIAGVLSAGGVGASSFKYGFINAYVLALELIDGTGTLHTVDKNSPLFHACLSGQGRCAVITKAKIALRPVQKQVKTFSLVYADVTKWFEDIERLKSKVDYMELFCSPSIQGSKLKQGKRVAMAQWLYGMHLSVEFSGKAPELNDIASNLSYWNVLNTQEDTIADYFLRHNPRFEMMRLLGQWDLYHPWYECFVPTKVLQDNLSRLLDELPLHYASLAQVVPIARQKAQLMMLPDDDSISEFMILNPGIPSVLKDSALQAVQDLDAFLLDQGGKRYLSGYLGHTVNKEYWQRHFGNHYDQWMTLKEQYDPHHIFNSVLHQISR